MNVKAKAAHRSLMIIAPLVMLFIGVVFGMIFYRHHLENDITKRAIYALGSNAKQEMRATDIAIDAQYRMLEMYAEIYVNQTANDEKRLWNIIKQMKAVQRSSNFFIVGIARPDGTAFTSFGTVIDLSDYGYFFTCMNGERAFELVDFDGLDSNSHFNLAVPIMVDGKAQGVVFGLCTEDAVRELIAPADSGNEGLSFLCDNNGNLLLSSDDGVFIQENDYGKTEHISNVFQILEQAVISGNSADNILEDIKAGRTGVFELTFGDKNSYAVYQPSGLNDWVLFNVMPGEYLEQELAISTKNVWGMLLIVLQFAGAATIVVLCISYYNSKIFENNQEQLRLSEAQAKLQKEKLEFALGRSSTRVWEYDLINNCIMQDAQLPAEVIENVPDSLIEQGRVHPDDVSRYIGLHNRVKNGEAYAFIEARLRHTDSNYIWHRIEYTTFFDEQGKPIRAVGVANDISEQKAAEKRYRDELAFRQIADPDTLISFCINCTTDTIEDAISYDKRLDRLTQERSFNDMTDSVAGTVPNDKERQTMKTELNTATMLRRFAEGTTSYKVEYRRNLGSGDGDMRWLSCSINLIRSPSSDDVMGFVYTRDINEKKILELVSSSTVLTDYEYLACLDMKEDYVYAARINRDISVAPKIEGECFSKRLIRLSKGELRMTPEQIVEMSIPSIKKRLEENDSYAKFFEVPTEDGKIARKKVHYTYLNREDGLVMLTRTDVTDIYKEEQRKNEMLSEALKAAENASRARGDFLAHMSHEIRTPLNGIRGMLDIIKGNPDENLKLYLDKAIISAKHLTGLINDILDMSKIDSGKMELNEAWFKTSEFVEYVEAIMLPQAEEKGIEFVSHLSWNGCVSVFTDGNRLKQICINLLSNAIKYTNRGGRVDYIVTATPIEDEMMSLAVMVADNGIGMDEGFLANAFEPFTQADSSFAKKGTGLGLSITKSLVELMNGRLTVESKPGAGTKIGFTVAMRGMRKQQDLQTGEAGLQTGKCELSLFGKHALVVDDHQINRLIAEKQLCAMGISVTTAGDGEQALELFKKSHDGYYDIIFMDIMMPVKDGLTATRELRKLNRNDAKTVNIVAMTANAFAEDIHKSLENGMNYHLSKPFDREQLVGILRQVFSKG